ncbi:AraC family transcriptional regulator [bacterium]|nr:AraC family transcriptional regulator [bacterium]NUN46546.1 helix-turn-helix transcriptional regulator [bacterium]
MLIKPATTLKKIQDERQKKKAETNLLFASTFYQIVDFKCKCMACGLSKPELQQSFSISYIRNGYFEYNVYKNTLEAYTGRVLVDKPGYQYSVRHIRSISDECTIFDFTDEFYHQIGEKYGNGITWYLQNKDRSSLLLDCGVELDYWHSLIRSKIRNSATSRLEMDDLIIQLLTAVIGHMSSPATRKVLAEKNIKFHLLAIEKAKEFIAEKFTEDFSLLDVARYCCVSPFHFSRIFKQITSYTPHQYLLSYRLQHAAMLINSTSLSLTEICYMSGFSRSDYFSAAFSKKYKISPSQFRQANRV